MSHYTANVKLYWNGTAVNATQGVLAFGVGDTVPDATVTRDSLFTGGFVTSQPDGGTPTPFTPISREIANATYKAVGPLLSTVPSWFVIAHRGGAGLAPESSLTAFDQALEMGADVIELGDWRLLADAGLAVCHDGAVNRTHNATGNTESFTTAGFLGLTQKGSTQFRGGFSDSPAVTAAQVLNRYGGQVRGFPEAKSTGSNDNAIVDAACLAITSRGLQTSVGLQANSFTMASRIAAAGVTAMYVGTTGAEQTPSAVAAAGIAYYAMTVSASAATITALKAAGIKTVGYTLDKQADVATFKANGGDGIFTNQPLYANGAQNAYKYRVTTASWTLNGRIPHGTIHVNDPTTATDTLLAITGSAGAYRMQPLSTHRNPILLGELCPIANAASTYTITATFTFDTTDSDSTSWAGIYFGFADDSGAAGTSDVAGNGWLAFVRQSGSVELFKATGGVYSSKGTQATAAITSGNSATITIAVTSTTVTVTRTDSGGFTAVTTTDSNNRGGYAYFRSNSKNSGLFSAGALTIT